MYNVQQQRVIYCYSSFSSL